MNKMLPSTRDETSAPTPSSQLQTHRAAKRDTWLERL